MMTAYGLGYLASLHRPDRTRDTDYATQARADFAWYASMNEGQLAAALRSMPVRRARTTQCKDEILQLWRDTALTYAQIAARVGCSPDYVYKTVKGAR